MSGGHHHDHHSTEQKPVAFTVPLILGCVTLLAVVLFLSLCDPKPHHAEGHGHEAATEAAHHDAAASSEHHAEEAKPAAASENAQQEAQAPTEQTQH